MALEVRLERRDLRETLLAHVTLMRPGACMREQVLLQRAGTHKVATAHLANVRPDVQVRFHVRRHALSVAETLAAHVARQRHRPTVRLEVNQQQVPAHLFSSAFFVRLAIYLAMQNHQKFVDIDIKFRLFKPNF